MSEPSSKRTHGTNESVRADRRRFCAGLVVIGASACTGASSTPADLAGADLAGETSSCATGVSAGPAAAIVEGQPQLVSSANVYVCRDAGGLYAVSARCTHQGCTVGVSGSAFACPCHGATFDLNGENPTSPAHSALPHYALCVDASGNAQIDKSQIVDPSSRT